MIQRSLDFGRVPQGFAFGFGESWDRKAILELFEGTGDSNPRVPLGSVLPIPKTRDRTVDLLPECEAPRPSDFPPARYSSTIAIS